MNDKKCKYCGVAKKMYNDKMYAREQKGHALETRNVDLSIYKCPNGEVWHLTSKKNSY